MTQFQRFLTTETVRRDADRMKPLADLKRQFEALQRTLSELGPVLPPVLTEFADAIRTDAAAFEPRISLIGQVKAGKTALANALVGAPDLLPSDVNPWTSVVTSVHLNAEPPGGHAAVFRFFDRPDWDALVESGGRLGEMAGRADADGELKAIAGQVAELQARTSERLGHNYRLLLGQAHRFRDFTPGLVRRYVCLGDEMESKTEGRFADLTRSADLFIKAPEFALPVVVEDTPGVNDPFLVREQMTIETLGRASICVLVLSAYQALSTVDLGLMRLLKTLRADQVVIFVNRVDELADRPAEMPRIEASIRSVLRKNGLEGDVPILFGSAVWAQRAITGDLSGLSEADWDTLTDPEQGAAAGTEGGTDERQVLQQHMRTLSGVPELKAVLARRIAEGPGRTSLNRLVRRTRDLVGQARVQIDSFSASRFGLGPAEAAEAVDLVVERLERRLSGIERETVGEIEALQASVVANWIDGIAAGLADAAPVVETADLRSELTQAYDGIAQDAVRKVEQLLADVEDDLRTVYRSLLSDGASLFPMVRPRSNEFGRPTPLARSSSFDVRGSWMENLRFGPSRDARRETRFRDMADREFRETLSMLERGPIRTGFETNANTFHGFVLPHIRNILLLAQDGAGEGSGVTLMTTRTAELRQTLGQLDERLTALDTAARPEKAASA